MNPFQEKPKAMDECFIDWKKLYQKPYDKNSVDPYTKARIILMNGIEVEAVMFGHQFHRNCNDNELRREAACLRRSEQMQQKTINWLSPGDETQIETTIGYEHLAVDLTAWLAAHEPNPYVKACMDFALLEDFDHLYRYANLLKMDHNIPAHKLVQEYVEITPGRPTIAHHRHPHDTVRYYCDFKKADIQTKLSTMIITAGEQQTMNFYMNIGNTYENDLGRQLYQEIGMVEEQHVTQYGALLDPNCSWLENMLMHEFLECYLYYSFYTDEPDRSIRKIWELHLEQEISHLHRVKELFEKYEKRQWEEVTDGEFPELLHFHDMKDYVREILGTQVYLTADQEEFVPINELPKEHDFYEFQQHVNKRPKEVPSHVVIEEMIDAKGEDYRYEVMENPVEELRDRKEDNIKVGRVAQKSIPMREKSVDYEYEKTRLPH
ncbi:MAG: hypothetical protein Q4E67_05225 [Planctomycetia bacterium]|nr:hypothetical protein [Planctomycetia bacterium]MDO5113756.1 hypothetical protein [Planctomycetia bacterium]